MGVPKFYRWISERYPCLSEEVKEFQLPEFDNLYLDMNGIIHVCSHPDDDNPHFRITEEKIFKDICHYIDFLFRMIKPRKVFFMAVDGVAPRAKMNQQRGRRFRSAREAEQLIEKAKKAGEVLPTEKRFDSNCITPGTPFMVRLQQHLKYFVVNKITNDPLWQGPQIYLSGHETPGEGEHKVMDYIRWSKSQPGYDGNTRHCLYGLDADLIMLGLTSHEPHFSLLREEVRFGGKKDKNKRTMTPEETTFHLLHLSLLRDYLAYEFSSLKGQLSFPWDLERLIDDWVMMGFLVGNDFIPHLPRFHIHKDALPILWNTYMTVLPTMDGYINEGGYLNLPRLERYFEELTKFDVEEFESAFSDLSYLESKLGGKSINESAGNNVKMRKLKPFNVNGSDAADPSSADGDELEDLSDFAESDNEDSNGNTLGDEFTLHKKDYYMNKMKYTDVTPDVLREQAHGYVKAIQWILLYYFEGVPSWSWYYPHHYAPYISDVRGFKDMNIIFDLSNPFLPFQQLMAVLPSASKDLLPPALQPLMTEATSSVIDFYPVDFETDLNGKQQEWEAVVLIPFIDERRLLSAMGAKQHLLTPEEKSRNTHGPHLMYQFGQEDQGFYPSSLPGVFPDLACNRARLTEFDMDLFHIESHALMKGLTDGVDLNVYYPGFPTLRHLPHTHELNSVGVKVFQHNSRSKSIVLHIQSKPKQSLEKIADDLLGKTTFVGWPHLHEAKVVAVANESFKIELVEESPRKNRKEVAVSFNRVPLDDTESKIVAREATTIKDRHMDRFAIDVGYTEVILYASPMTGRSYTYGSQGMITLEKQFASNPLPFAHQMTVSEIRVQESGHTTFKTLDEVFPLGSTIFMLGTPHYGAQGKVKEIQADTGRVRIALNVTEEPDMRELGQMHLEDSYLAAYQASQLIGIDAHIMSRITGSVFVEQAKDNHRVNVGLNLKFTKRGEEVPGYTRKEEHGWTYSRKCVDVVAQYISRFQDVWLRIHKLNTGNDFLSERDLFPEGSASSLKDVTDFLQELPCAKAPRMKFGAEILDDDQVARIEKKTASMNKVPSIVKIRIKPFLLFRPMAGQGSLVPDPEADFFLYDRVVVVKSGYSFPFGKRGTIIGIPPEEGNTQSPHRVYDVVFDEAFTGGVTLRCSPHKGYRVPGSAMINLTFGEFRKNRPPSQRMTVGAWNGGKLHSKTGPSGSHGPLMDSNKNNTTGQPLYNDRAGPYNQSRSGPGSRGQQPMWDSKGQPLFGQVFASGQMNQGRSPNQGELKFVTPKVPVPRHVMTAKKPVPSQKTENVDFDSVWKSLINQDQSKTPPTKDANLHGQRIPVRPATQSMTQQQPSSNPALSSAAPSSSTSSSQSNNQTTLSSVQKLFEHATRSGAPPQPQPSTENAEFLAMFNSLKIQSEEMRKSSHSPKASVPVVGQATLSASLSSQPAAHPQSQSLAKDVSVTSESDVADTKVKNVDDALKELLKIGGTGGRDFLAPPDETAASSLESSSQPARTSPSYGRQVSLQELFDEANRHMTNKQQPGAGVSPQVTEGKPPADNRDPLAELESYCKANGLPPPSYDFKHQPKQMSYIANVNLPGRGRFEGSMCQNRNDAAKSAASMALLCLKSKPSLVHPALAGLLPVPPRHGTQQQFFSANSAFSPIGLPGQAVQHRPPSLIPPATLLTPQHFLNQPSHLRHQLFTQPPHMLHRHPQQNLALSHQQQQQQQQLQYQQQHLRQQLQNRPQVNLPPSLSNQSTPPSSFLTSSTNQKQAPADSLTESGNKTSSSAAQPFIPLQVYRNQKMPKGKKENQPELASDTTSILPSESASDVLSSQGKAAPALPVSTAEQSAAQKELLGTQSLSEKLLSSTSSSDLHTETCRPPGPLADTKTVEICPSALVLDSVTTVSGPLGQNGAIPPSHPASVAPSSTTSSSLSTVSSASQDSSQVPGAIKQSKTGQPKKKSRLAANFSRKV